MPTYDYLCPNDHRFEVIHSVTADGPEICPVCGAAPVRKAFTAPTFHFKGTGWAKKDRSSSSRSTRAAAATDGTPGSSTATGDGAGDDAKPSGAPEAKPAADGKPAGGSGSGSSTTGPSPAGGSTTAAD